jgi:hypothetical protein
VESLAAGAQRWMVSMKHFLIRMPKQIAIPLFAIAVLSFGTSLSYGQKAWEKKPYEEWTPQETLGILLDSPWAQLRAENNQSVAHPTIIRLRSALPIRQALVRQKKIYLNDHKFTATDKTRFNSDVKEFLECSDCAKNYIVTLSSEALTGLRGLSFEQVKPYIYLANDKGERRHLIHFIPPKSDRSEAMFVFERFDDAGQPLITVDNKAFYFKIGDKLLENKTVPIERFKFEVSKMIQNNQVVF